MTINPEKPINDNRADSTFPEMTTFRKAFHYLYYAPTLSRLRRGITINVFGIFFIDIPLYRILRYIFPDFD